MLTRSERQNIRKRRNRALLRAYVLREQAREAHYRALESDTREARKTWLARSNALAAKVRECVTRARAECRAIWQSTKGVTTP